MSCWGYHFDCSSMSTLWKFALLLLFVPIVNLALVGRINADGSFCPEPGLRLGPCIDECERDINCKSGEICCKGGCEKSPMVERPDGKKEYYNMCLKPDPCAKVVCQHGGTCYSYMDTFQCACAKGYMGDYCEANIDDCKQKPCKNGGKCMDMLNDYQCCCPAGYAGKNCTQVDLCPARACFACKKFPEAKCFTTVHMEAVKDGKQTDVTEECLHPHSKP